MKKILLIGILTLLPLVKSLPCGGDWEDYYYYYSLVFSQELINDTRYYPFLLSLDVDYYEADSVKVRNANIEEWQAYLKIPYEQAHYLVFKAGKEEVQKLVANNNTANKQLKFADSRFVKKYKDALEYLVLAKELEPYMAISRSYGSWSYYEEGLEDIDKLPYDLISLRLQKGWKQAKDEEIKLRYGYQLVRFAHYNRKYEEAIRLFDLYVEPLKIKPEMYYYALSQKAGAIRGTGDVIRANTLFFEVFSYSADLKSSALSSIKFNDNVDYQRFLVEAQTVNEKNDADLLLGYLAFSNPLSSARKIAQRSPDAVQAKVLTARAISIIEHDIKKYGDVSGYKDRRFPILNNSAQKAFKEALGFVGSQAESAVVKKKNYWNIALAYLHYLDRNYPAAQTYLDRVDVGEEGYKEQHDILAMLVDIGRENRITGEVEERIFAQYNDLFSIKKHSSEGRTKVASFVVDLLSNRYYLQDDYAKSFMLLNSLAALEGNPNLYLLDEIEALYNKPNKNTFEQYLTREFKIGLDDASEEAKVSVPDYIKYMKGIVFLTEGHLDKAKTMFESCGYSRRKLSSDVFGYNQIECFDCEENMRADYLSEFSYINSSMSEAELVNTLIRLSEDAEGSDLKSAKACYLFGNFFYNTSVTGHFRSYLRFDSWSSYCMWFFDEKDRNSLFKNRIFLKSIPTFYDNPVEIANHYLEKAYDLASGDEFKARIAFALSKCEQEMHYQKLATRNEGSRWRAYNDEDWVMISDRQYFRELMKYKNTRFFGEVKSNCKYFDYYVNHL